MEIPNNPILALIITVLGSGILIKALNVIEKTSEVFIKIRKHFRSYNLMVISDLKKDVEKAQKSIDSLKEEKEDEKDRYSNLSLKLYKVGLVIKKLIAYLKINGYTDKDKNIKNLVNEIEEELNK